MPDSDRLKRVREGALSAWRGSLLVAAVVVVLSMYAGTVLLVYEGRMTDGPLVLMTGVILGYILHMVRDLI